MNHEHSAWFAIRIVIRLNPVDHIEEHAGSEGLTLSIHGISNLFALLPNPLVEILSLLRNDGLGEIVQLLI